MNWRDIPDIKPEHMHDVLQLAGSPLARIAGDVYDASTPHSALALAMLHVESQYGTQFNANTPERKNFLNLRPPQGDGYLLFQTPIQGIKAWRDRITSPTYKDGIYAKTTTLEELIHVYAPSSDNNNEAEYVRSIERDLATWGITPKENSMAITYGHVPYPSVIQKHLPASNPYVQESGAPDVPDAVFWHRMIGSLNGTNGWFFGGNAATAYGVGVKAIEPTLAGVIYEWIAPRTGWYGESSGPVKQPYGDGIAYVNEVGVGSVNRRSKAIEISGDVDTPLDEAARDAIANLTAYWADQRKIPYTEFPLLKSAGRSFVIWHNEVTGLAFKTCPGAVVMNETAALIERTKQVMWRYQESTPAPEPSEYAPKHPIPGPIVSQMYGGKSFIRATGSLTLAASTAPLEWASPTAQPTSAPYDKGRKVSPAYATVGDDLKTWIVEKSGNRWPFDVFEEGQ